MVELEHRCGHESVERTAYFVDMDAPQRRATIGPFESATAEALTAGA